MKALKIIIAIATVFGATAVQSVSAIESELWISPNGPANTAASGTPSDPFRCPDPASLDTVLINVLTNNYLTIHLMGGTFYVSTNGINLRTGWKLRGAGIDNTTVQLYPTANSVTQLSVIGGWGALFPINNNCEVSDLTVDCNFQNTGPNSSFGAVTLAGSNTRISRVKAINWGTGISGAECFVLYLAPPPFGSDATNCVIDNCIVTQPAPRAFADGATAISIFVDTVAWARTNRIYGAVMKDNLVMNITTGTGLGQPAYINAYGGGGIVSHNQAINLIGNAEGVYRDTYDGRDIVIEDNVFDNVSRCVYFNMSTYSVTGLVIKNNVFRPAEGGLGIAYYAGSALTGATPLVTNFIIDNNVIYPSSFTTNCTALSLAGPINVSVINNVLQHGGTNNYDVFIPYQDNSNPFNGYPNANTVQFSTWAGNVNMSGTQLVQGTDVYWQPESQSSITFTATNSGWYRINTGVSWLSGDIKLESGFWNNYATDTEFSFRVNGYSSSTNDFGFGNINIVRLGSYYIPGGQVPAARVGSDNPNSPAVYLDIYVGGIPGALPIKITAKGPFRGSLLTTPQLITTAPALYKVVNFGAYTDDN